MDRRVDGVDQEAFRVYRVSRSSNAVFREPGATCSARGAVSKVRQRTVGTEKAVVTNAVKTRRQHVLQDSTDTFLPGHPLPLRDLRPRRCVAKLFSRKPKACA